MDTIGLVLLAVNTADFSCQDKIYILVLEQAVAGISQVVFQLFKPEMMGKIACAH